MSATGACAAATGAFVPATGAFGLPVIAPAAPSEALWREIGKHRTMISLGEFLRLKELFRTSFQAITYRCLDLGIITGALFRKLFQSSN